MKKDILSHTLDSLRNRNAVLTESLKAILDELNDVSNVYNDFKVFFKKTFNCDAFQRNDEIYVVIAGRAFTLKPSDQKLITVLPAFELSLGCFHKYHCIALNETNLPATSNRMYRFNRTEDIIRWQIEQELHTLDFLNELHHNPKARIVYSSKTKYWISEYGLPYVSFEAWLQSIFNRFACN